MKSYLTRVLGIVIFLAIGGLASTGCETVQGAGADIENAGEAMEDAVD